MSTEAEAFFTLIVPALLSAVAIGMFLNVPRIFLKWKARVHASKLVDILNICLDDDKTPKPIVDTIFFMSQNIDNGSLLKGMTKELSLNQQSSRKTMNILNGLSNGVRKNLEEAVDHFIWCLSYQDVYWGVQFQYVAWKMKRTSGKNIRNSSPQAIRAGLKEKLEKIIINLARAAAASLEQVRTNLEQATVGP